MSQPTADEIQQQKARAAAWSQVVPLSKVIPESRYVNGVLVHKRKEQDA